MQISRTTIAVISHLSRVFFGDKRFLVVQTGNPQRQVGYLDHQFRQETAFHQEDGQIIDQYVHFHRQ